MFMAFIKPFPPIICDWIIWWIRHKHHGHRTNMNQQWQRHFAFVKYIAAPTLTHWCISFKFVVHEKVLYLYFVVYKTFYRWEWTDVMLDEQQIKMKCLNATSLVAEWYSACFAGQSTRHPDIHGGATDSTSSTAGRVARVTKTNVFIGQAFAARTIDRRNPDDRSYHLYN